MVAEQEGRRIISEQEGRQIIAEQEGRRIIAEQEGRRIIAEQDGNVMSVCMYIQSLLLHIHDLSLPTLYPSPFHWVVYNHCIE